VMGAIRAYEGLPERSDLGFWGVRFWIVALGHSFCFLVGNWETGTGIGVLGIFVFIYTKHTPKVAAVGGAFGWQRPPRRNGVSRQAGVGDLGDPSGSGEFRHVLSLFFVCLSFVILSFYPFVFLPLFFVVLFHKTTT
jgi:hypothetical protein